MQLRDLLDLPDLRLNLLSDAPMDRTLRWVFTTDLIDPARYLSGGELVLTGLVWRRQPEDSAGFVAALAARGVAALAAGDAAFGSIPDDVVEACRTYEIPLLEVPVDVSFAAITEHVMQRLTREREGDLAAVLGQRRRLAAALAEGDGLDGLLDTWQREVGAPCWILTATGRRVGGATSTLDDTLTLRLADAYLRASSLPVVAEVEDARYSLFPVTTRAGHRLPSWFLACEGDHRHWPGDLQDSVTELVSLIAFERARLDERRRSRWLVAEQLLKTVLSGRTEPAAAAEDLHAAGIDLHEPHVAISLVLSGSAQPMELACPVLEGLLESLAPAAVLGPAGEDAIALAQPSGTVTDLVARLRDTAPRLEPGLGSGRLLIGLGEPARGTGGLREAVEEARLARRLAEVRPGRASVLTCDEVDSHALLLATTPQEVRAMFRQRLLGPVRDYDARNNTDLMATLEDFLSCSGSWSRCARRLHIHVNTLRYRIGRVEELTGRSLTDLESRVDFFLALRSGPVATYEQ